jgi:hypothetical protein
MKFVFYFQINLSFTLGSGVEMTKYALFKLVCVVRIIDSLMIELECPWRYFVSRLNFVFGTDRLCHLIHSLRSQPGLIALVITYDFHCTPSFQVQIGNIPAFVYILMQ